MLGGLAPLSGIGAPAWSAGDKPVWEYGAVKDLILARSLEGAPTRESVAQQGGSAAPSAQPLTQANLTEGLQLMHHSLRSLFESEAAVSLKQVVGQVHACFERAVGLMAIFAQVKDHASFFELLTTLVSQIKSLTPGASVVIPGGFKGGLLLYVLHADSFEECTLAVCAVADGLEYHPCAPPAPPSPPSHC
jgi:hypothetical protein